MGAGHNLIYPFACDFVASCSGSGIYDQDNNTSEWTLHSHMQPHGLGATLDTSVRSASTFTSVIGFLTM